ncbi:hypothetical protein JHW43_009324 [Diplocarpon mali]|nr:hypothetical protein JHW43_009324 [Diplocarpon mali]
MQQQEKSQDNRRNLENKSQSIPSDQRPVLKPGHRLSPCRRFSLPWGRDAQGDLGAHSPDRIQEAADSDDPERDELHGLRPSILRRRDGQRCSRLGVRMPPNPRTRLGVFWSGVSTSAEESTEEPDSLSPPPLSILQRISLDRPTTDTSPKIPNASEPVMLVFSFEF